MSRIAFCQACFYEKHGVKPRLPSQHICDKGNYTAPKKPRCINCDEDAIDGLLCQKHADEFNADPNNWPTQSPIL